MEKIEHPINERFRGYLPVVVDIETAGFDAKKKPLLENGWMLPILLQ